MNHSFYVVLGQLRHVTECCCESSVCRAFDERKLDDHELDRCFGYHYHHYHKFFASWHLQAFKDVFEDVDDLAGCSVDEQDPSGQSRVYHAQQDADDVCRHRITVEAYDLNGLCFDSQAAEDESNHCRKG